jgi:hypothetical protein
MYTAYLLSEKSRKTLYFLFPPKYPEFIGHHITEEFGVPEGTEPPEQPKLVEVVGYIDNGDGVEGFLVEVNGNTQRPSGGKYHITWSIDRDRGYKPVHTNKYTGNAENIDPIKIEVEPKVLR